MSLNFAKVVISNAFKKLKLVAYNFWIHIYVSPVVIKIMNISSEGKS